MVPLAVNACKLAWQKFIDYCAKHTDDKSKTECDRYKADPKDFLVTRVLRAGVNPIDAGYRCALSVEYPACSEELSTTQPSQRASRYRACMTATYPGW